MWCREDLPIGTNTKASFLIGGQQCCGSRALIACPRDVFSISTGFLPLS